MVSYRIYQIWNNITKEIGTIHISYNIKKQTQRLLIYYQSLSESIIHNDPHELTFKLVRDTSFSYDKSPYNPAFRAHNSSAGKLPVPVGYYIKIQLGNRSFLGGGLYAEWQKIINDESFLEVFCVKRVHA